MVKRVTTPLRREQLGDLHAGDQVLISGEIYTARDAAHKRLVELVEQGKSLPIDVKDQIIYYVGPCPAKEGEVIGSCGPTTSGRMDAYAPTLIRLGETGMIGKGERLPEVYAAMQEFGCVYFGATGGAGALLASCVEKVEEIAYPDLLSESIKRLTVKDFPVIVIGDIYGGNLYRREEY